MKCLIECLGTNACTKRSTKPGAKPRVKPGVKYLITVALAVTALFWLQACDPKFIEPEPEQSFTRVYNWANDTDYTSLDIKQTPDGGYIVLAEINGYPFLVRVNRMGDFLWDSGDSGKNYIDPVGEIQVVNDDYYFVSSKYVDDDTLMPYLLGFNQNTKQFEEVVAFESMVGFKTEEERYTYDPVHATVKGKDDYLLFTVNSNGYRTKLDGGESGDNWLPSQDSAYYRGDWGCLLEYPMLDQRYFLTGRMANTGKYYFQMHLTDLFFILKDKINACFMITLEVPCNGNTYCTVPVDRSVTAMVWDDSRWDVSAFDGTRWDGLTLTGAYIDEGVVYFFLNAEVKTVSIGDGFQWPTITFSDGDTAIFPQSELDPERPVFIKIASHAGRDVAFMAGSTKYGKIALYAYDLSYDRPLGSETFFGEMNDYETAGLINTGDGGLAILGNTDIMDRMKRICIFKLSKQDVENIIGEY